MNHACPRLKTSRLKHHMLKLTRKMTITQNPQGEYELSTTETLDKETVIKQYKQWLSEKEQLTVQLDELTNKINEIENLIPDSELNPVLSAKEIKNHGTK